MVKYIYICLRGEVMLYRNYGKTNEKVSALGFGCMRFPTINGKINEEVATKMLRHAIDSGVTYVDTAYPYHNGTSEDFVGRVLKDGYREKVLLATKLPSWLIKSREDMDKYINEQLNRLQTDHIDFYLVHALNADYFSNLKKLGLFEFLDSIKKSGKVKHLGFSFHDKLEVFKEIVDSYDWEFCQIQYNFLDLEYQAGNEGLQYAYDKGLGVAIMEPLRGGKLVTNIPNDIQALWDKASVKRTPVEWALRFLWDDPRIGVVLSGMSTMEQVTDNISIAEKGEINSLTSEEKLLISQVREKYLSKIKVNCTDCKYCMPCAVGVNIPRNFELLNNSSLFEDVEGTKKFYHSMLKETEKADKCIECGRCETVCPQHIEIRKMLKETTATFL